MVKIDILRSIVKRTEGYNQKDVEAILNAYSDVVLDTLKDNRTDKIPLFGIGYFTTKHINEKSGVSTLRGTKEWKVPAHDELKFVISNTVKKFD